jgi:hypothetical protein
MISGQRRILATTERVEELYDVRAAVQSINEYGQEIKAAQTQVGQRTLVEGLLRQQGSENCRAANVPSKLTVDNFETAIASNFNKLQQLSTSSLQAVQHQTVRIPQISTDFNNAWNLVRDQG